jgi:hypothetical protein
MKDNTIFFWCLTALSPTWAFRPATRFVPSTVRTSTALFFNNDYMPPEVLPPARNFKANSTHRLSRKDLQRAMTDVKRFVESRLESDLNLIKVGYHLIVLLGCNTLFLPKSYSSVPDSLDSIQLL